jgi:predicted transcriptional regulator
MSTTTIRLPPELKVRVAAAARRSGTTPHAFILAAIAERTDADQRRAELEALAQERYQGIVASEQTIPWDEMRQYLRARVTGKKTRKPTPRSISR